MDAVETMAYSGELPWHGKGNFTAEPLPSAEFISLAELDWTVALGPVFAGKDADSAYALENRRCTVRTSDNSVLGIVGPEYQPIQNNEVFSFLDSLVQDNVLRFETGGSLFGGAWVWALAKLAEDMRVGNDEYRSYLLGVTSHDGSSSLKVFTTDVRVVCNNTLRMAIGRQAGPLGIIGHSGDVKAKMEAAQKVMAISTENQRRLQEYLTKLAEVKVEAPVLAKVTSGLFRVEMDAKTGSLDEETPGVKKAAVERFLKIYNEEIQANGPTAYSLFQAVTGYADHGIQVRKDKITETRTEEVPAEAAAPKAKGKGKGKRAADPVVPAEGEQAAPPAPTTREVQVEVEVERPDSRMKRFMGKSNDFKRDGLELITTSLKLKDMPKLAIA